MGELRFVGGELLFVDGELAMHDDCCCCDCETEGPTALFTYEATGADPCEMDFFDDSTAGSCGEIVSWSWSKNSTPFSTDQHPVDVEIADGDEISLTVTDSAGCTDTYTETIFLYCPAELRCIVEDLTMGTFLGSDYSACTLTAEDLGLDNVLSTLACGAHYRWVYDRGANCVTGPGNHRYTLVFYFCDPADAPAALPAVPWVLVYGGNTADTCPSSGTMTSGGIFRQHFPCGAPIGQDFTVANHGGQAVSCTLRFELT